MTPECGEEHFILAYVPLVTELGLMGVISTTHT